jgi:nucleotide-binding universal stress UspA family protein
MKSILLHVGEDPAFESRLQASLDLTRFVGGHLECLQTRRVPAFLGADTAGFAGGAAMMMQLVDEETRAAEAERQRLSARLGGEQLAFSFSDAMGDPVETLTDRSLLADCVVMSLPDAQTPEMARTLSGVVTRADAPVLAVPPAEVGIRFGEAVMVAWKPTAEAANALKAALPLLQKASRVDVVAVDPEGVGDFPATAVASYLARHDIGCELHERRSGQRSTSDVLLGAATELESSLLVMGGYGRSRAMEFLLGGVTRRLLSVSSIPLLLAH